MADQVTPGVWRTGRSVGRTVYRQRGSDPARGDELIGLMDTPELAATVVAAVNAWHTGDDRDRTPAHRQDGGADERIT